MKKILLNVMAIGGFIIGLQGTAQASPVSWTDWTSTTAGASMVIGSITSGSDIISVTYSGPYAFAQTNGGTNYWTPTATYTSTEVGNAPPASDIIALSTGGQKTISFSQDVVDPILALVSWNGNTVDFGVPIDILNYGTGAYGSGTPILNMAGTGFYGSGEVHGIIRIPGTFNSITFTDTSENWHGFTVGIVGTGGQGSEVPEPTTMLLFGSGIACLASRRIRRNRN